MYTIQLLTSSFFIFAQDGAADSTKSSFQTLLIIPIMLVAMYFLVILPNKKEDKKRKEMIANLQKGDNVVTNSGLHGKIVEFKDNNETVVISISANTNVTFETSAIQKKK
ncbi:preprotein translocase subunit YajC [Leptospira sp. 'Mane']|uniref:preprotein translocase subunit YajC n=1 Tax=Leptospira sp. 'Mane' TaxID=3387407 RepID=UPI00398A8D40